MSSLLGAINFNYNIYNTDLIKNKDITYVEWKSRSGFGGFSRYYTSSYVAPFPNFNLENLGNKIIFSTLSSSAAFLEGGLNISPYEPDIYKLQRRSYRTRTCPPLLKDEGKGIINLCNKEILVPDACRTLEPVFMETKLDTIPPIKLLPWYVTGFADGRASFLIKISKDSLMRKGYRVEVKFSFILPKQELTLLTLIQSYFEGIGKISNPASGRISYTVSDLEALNIVIAHFERYPLITHQWVRYKLFKRAVEIMKVKGHLETKGLEEIFNLHRLSLDLSASNPISGEDDLSRTGWENAPHKTSYLEELIISMDQKIKDPNWVSGFFSGVGSFTIRVRKSVTPSVSHGIELSFSLTYHKIENELIKSLVHYLGCGQVNYTKDERVKFNVTTFSDLMNKFYPFFQKYPLYSYLQLVLLEGFGEVLLLVKNKEHLTLLGLEKIIKIKSEIKKVSGSKLGEEEVSHNSLVYLAKIIEKVKSLNIAEDVYLIKDRAVINQRRSILASTLKNIPESLSNQPTINLSGDSVIANPVRKLSRTSSSLEGEQYKALTGTFALNPWFLTGFTDAEGSFMILVLPRVNFNTGWRVIARFSIGLHSKDAPLLQLIKCYLGVGSLEREVSQVASFRVTRVKDIINVIIPHFLKYPLITQKRTDFELFKRAVDLINQKKHLTEEGIQEIVRIKSALNLGLSPKLKDAFSHNIPLIRSLAVKQEIQDFHWLSGFTSGDGNFSAKVNKSFTTKIGFSVQLTFNLYQHNKDLDLMKNLRNYLGCGKVYVRSNKLVVFSVARFKDIIDIIIPLFKKHPIHGVKAKDFADFVEISELIKAGEHLNPEGFSRILKIKASMNKGRLIEEDNEEEGKVEESSSTLYMYNRDKTILYHSTKNVKEFSEYLKIYKNTLFKHIEKGTFYLGKYSFSWELSPSVERVDNLTLAKLDLMLSNDRKSA